MSSNEKLENELRNSISFQDEFDKCKLENVKFSKEISDLKNSISKFQKGKETLDNILDSQKSYKNTRGLGYAKNIHSSSSSLIFVKAKMNTTQASTSGVKTSPTHAKESYIPKTKF